MYFDSKLLGGVSNRGRAPINKDLLSYMFDKRLMSALGDA
jgi:hypothetical protein